MGVDLFTAAVIHGVDGARGGVTDSAVKGFADEEAGHPGAVSVTLESYTDRIFAPLDFLDAEAAATSYAILQSCRFSWCLEDAAIGRRWNAVKSERSLAPRAPWVTDKNIGLRGSERFPTPDKSQLRDNTVVLDVWRTPYAMIKSLLYVRGAAIDRRRGAAKRVTPTKVFLSKPHGIFDTSYAMIKSLLYVRGAAIDRRRSAVKRVTPTKVLLPEPHGVFDTRYAII
ncbi:hypothetical protein K438DRAFT_1752336 [Mycena galopus ATCC 62051]|nr:hypothetical protein K438DRAFT_1752336 [Mycena galopus ATCC 62051]